MRAEVGRDFFQQGAPAEMFRFIKWSVFTVTLWFGFVSRRGQNLLMGAEARLWSNQRADKKTRLYLLSPETNLQLRQVGGVNATKPRPPQDKTCGWTPRSSSWFCSSRDPHPASMFPQLTLNLPRSPEANTTAAVDWTQVSSADLIRRFNLIGPFSLPHSITSALKAAK